MARTSPLSLQGGDSVNECEGLLRVVTIGPGELNGQRNSASVTNQMTLAAELRSVGGVGTRSRPPKTARTELPSTTARDQSICPQRASQSSKTKWISCQMPASCQSRSLRQQLIPEPQFISCGSIRQGIPLRRTNKTPWRQARSDRRGLPPWGLAVGAGRNGSIRFHKASGRRGVAMKSPSRNSYVLSYHSKRNRIGFVTASKPSSSELSHCVMAGLKQRCPRSSLYESFPAAALNAPESQSTPEVIPRNSSQPRWPEVGFGEIAIDLLQARFWISSGLPTNRERLHSCFVD
jgi:hypothetical protein